MSRGEKCTSVYVWKKSGANVHKAITAGLGKGEMLREREREEERESEEEREREREMD